MIYDIWYTIYFILYLKYIYYIIYNMCYLLYIYMYIGIYIEVDPLWQVYLRDGGRAPNRRGWHSLVGQRGPVGPTSPVPLGCSSIE